MSGTCRVNLMGRFQVTVEGRPVPVRAWHHDADAVVKLLALEPIHRLAQNRVTARLWPRLDAESAAKQLQKSVKHACKALGSRQAVTVDGDLVHLWPTGALDVDVQRFVVLADRAASERGAREALAEYGGDLLPEDRDTAWVAPYRAELQGLQRELLALGGRVAGVVDVSTTQRVLNELEGLRPS